MNHLSIRIEGGLLSPDFLETIHEASGQKPQDFGLKPRDSLVDEVSAIWGDVLTYWNAFQRRKARSTESLTTITREQWLLPLLDALGYSLTFQRSAVELDGRSYLISHRAGVDETAPPVHIVAYDQTLGDRPPSGRATLSPHALVQDYLNRTDDHLWGIVSNGRILRLLRDSTYFTRPAYIEFDLEQMILAERLDEFFLLYRLAHRSRLPQPDIAPADCLLEQYHLAAIEQGGRIRDGLRQAVADAIITFGNSFLRHPRNDSLRTRLHRGDLTVDAFYQQLLYLIYRLLFLMVAEERNLLASDGPASAYFRHYFSVTRLRQLADTPLSAPERFDDLYLGLRTLFYAFHDEQMAAQLGVPPLNGELFSQEKASDLDAAYLNNRDLLHAIRLLSYFTPPDEQVRRRVNYAALDVEELGSVYESLLDEQPVVDGLQVASGEWQVNNQPPATSRQPLTFSFISGTTRKTTGSYYTPRELVNEVIKSALVPVIEARLAEATQSPISRSEAAQSPQETALLALRVCDPACGSGHFLLAAARRLGYELAKVRSGADEPSPDLTREATRDAITHCIYGVDRNPLAVDLCKVALWIEGFSRGKPLTFLDYRIRCGDSLVGVQEWAVLDEGIPDAAFDAVSGDDKTTARGLKKQNKEERAGQMSLFDQLGGTTRLPDATDWQALEEMPEDTPAQVNAKQARHRELRQRSEQARTEANLWTSAFFSQLTPENLPNIPTTDVLRRFRSGQVVSGQVVGAANGMAAENRFFHWPLEFPQVFSGGGFDAVLGNPPWERIKLQETEFFAASAPKISNAKTKTTRNQLIKRLELHNKDLYDAYLNALHYADSLGKFLRIGPRFPLTGMGDINTYSVFSELAQQLISGQGYAGIIIPTGIVTDHTTRNFFESIIQMQKLSKLIGFENEAFIFPAVHNQFKFCILVTNGEEIQNEEADFVFFCRYFYQALQEERHFSLSRDDFYLINPNTKTCPVFRTKMDGELTKKIYRHLPILYIDDANNDPWQVRFMRVFDMNNVDVLQLCKTIDIGDNNIPQGYVNMVEAKMIDSYDHRFATLIGQNQAGFRPSRKYKGWYGVDTNDPHEILVPRYRLPIEKVKERIDFWQQEWFFAYRDISNAVSERTYRACILPFSGTDFTIRILFSKTSTLQQTHLLGNINSLPYDYVARQNVAGTHLSDYITKQLPIVPPNRYSAADQHFIVPRVLELVYTAWDIAPFTTNVWQEADEPLRQALRAQWEANRQATGGHQWPVNSEQWAANSGQKPPFPPCKWDDERRAHLRAELDAYYARLYGLTRDELRYILDPADIYGPDFPGETFRVLKEKEIKAHGEFRTQRLVLAAWDAQQTAIDSGELEFTLPAPTHNTETQLNSEQSQSGRKEAEKTIIPHSQPVTVREPAPTLELKSPPVRPTPKLPAAKPSLDEQPALVTDFTPPSGSYSQRLKRIMALAQPKNQVELTELIAALGDENDNIRWLAGSALTKLGGLPVIRLLAAYLQTNPGAMAPAEVLRVLKLIGEMSEDDEVKTAVELCKNF